MADGAGNASAATAALNVGGPGAPTITGTHATATTSKTVVTPMCSVTVPDPSAAMEMLTIALTGSGGMLAAAGLMANADGISLLTGSAEVVTAQFDALRFTPTAGAAGTASTTTFVLTDASSAGTSVTDVGTSLADTDPAVAPAPTSQPTPSPVATDAVSLNDQVYYDRGALVVSGTASSAAGVSRVEITADVDGIVTDLGAATVVANGNLSFWDRVGAHPQGFITATETDKAGVRTSAQADPSLTGVLSGPSRAEPDRHGADGSVVTAMDLSKASGAQGAILNAGGLTLFSDTEDVFENNGQSSSTFVFKPGYGHDVVDLFRPDNTDHDTLSFKGSDFGNSVATVLAHTVDDENGDAVNDDPGITGDAVDPRWRGQAACCSLRSAGHHLSRVNRGARTIGAGGVVRLRPFRVRAAASPRAGLTRQAFPGVMRSGEQRESGQGCRLPERRAARCRPDPHRSDAAARHGRPPLRPAARGVWRRATPASQSEIGAAIR